MTFDGMEQFIPEEKERVVYKKQKRSFISKLIEEIKTEIWVRQFIKHEFKNPLKYPELFN